MKQRTAGVIISNSEGGLLLRLSDGMWTIFGSKVEEDESPKEALIREMVEEVGIVLQDIKFFRKFYHDDTEQHIFSARFDGKVDRRYLKAGEDARFFDREEIKKIEPSLNIKNVFREFLRSKSPFKP